MHETHTFNAVEHTHTHTHTCAHSHMHGAQGSALVGQSARLPLVAEAADKQVGCVRLEWVGCRMWRV